MKHVQATVMTMAATCLLCAGWVWAQTEAKPIDTSDISGKVRFTKAQFDSLLEKMELVAVRVEKAGDAESAKIIRAAMEKAKEKFISKNMGDVQDLLTKSLTGAYTKEKEVQAALDEVLRLLREGAIDSDREDYKKWLERTLEDVQKLKKDQEDLKNQSADNLSPAGKEMADLMQQLESIVKEQEALKAQTDKMGQGDPEIKKMSDLRDAIEDLIHKQDKVAEATKDAPIGERPAVGKVQDKVAEQTQAVKDKLEAAAKDDKIGKMLASAGADKEAMQNAAKSAAQAQEEMGKASQSLSKSDAKGAEDPQTQAKSDLENAKKELDNAIAKMGEQTPAAEQAKKQDALADKTSKLGDKVQAAAAQAGMKADSANMKAASGQMSKASEAMSGQNSPKASEHQQKALEELKGKKTELAQLKRKIEEKKPTTPEQQKPKQDEISKKAEDIAKEMEKKGEEKGQPSPGQQPMKDAKASSGKASDQLDKKDSQGANDEQKKAIDELQKAEDELAKALDDEKDKKDEEKLAKIDQILSQALEQQKVISAGTKTTYAKRTGNGDYARKELQELTGLSDGEGRIQGDVAKVSKLLADEKETVVFPEILRDVNDKLIDTQKNLAEKEAGLLTQATQVQIEESLQSMIDAIRMQLAEHRDKKKGGGGSGQGSPGGKKPPLIPPIAELKMLYLREMQIARETQFVDKMSTAGQLPKDMVESKNKALAEDQKKVKGMTDEMIKKLNKGQPQPDGGAM